MGIRIITSEDGIEPRLLATTFSLIYAVSGKPVLTVSGKPVMRGLIPKPPCSWAGLRKLLRDSFEFEVDAATKVLMRNQALNPWDILTADDVSGHVTLSVLRITPDPWALQETYTDTCGPHELLVMLCKPCHALYQVASCGE